MKEIKTINDIDYKNNPEGRLLFSALTILTTTEYRDKTPDEVIEIVSKHADSFLEKWPITAYVHEIKLSGKDEFSNRFNYVSWLWQQSCNPDNSPEKQEFYQNEHFAAKYNLEQGLPISFLNEYNP